MSPRLSKTEWVDAALALTDDLAPASIPDTDRLLAGAMQRLAASPPATAVLPAFIPATFRAAAVLLLLLGINVLTCLVAIRYEPLMRIVQRQQVSPNPLVREYFDTRPTMLNLE